MSRPPYFVLSFSGTSLLLNGAYEEQRRLLNKYTNAKTPGNVPEVDRQAIQQIIEIQRSKLQSAEAKLAANLSAELKGLINLYDGQLTSPPGQKPDYHVLLCTDTWLGEFASKCVCQWLTDHGLQAEVLRQRDLQTEDIAEFQAALTEVVEWCDQTIPEYQRADYRVVFNLTAGFKSIQGFLQTLAMFYADESVYIFEGADTLLRIPRLPIRIHADESIEVNLQAFRRIALGLEVTPNASVAIPETLLLKIEGVPTLSTWGELIWKQTRPQLYAKQIWPSPSSRVRLGAGFERSVRNLSPDRRMLINERIDDLVAFLEGTRPNLPSLDFKPLKSNPIPPMTHELDAWADQDAKRLFGYYEGDVFVIDRLDKALH